MESYGVGWSRQPIRKRIYDILTGAYNRSPDDAVPLSEDYIRSELRRVLSNRNCDHFLQASAGDRTHRH